MAQGRTTSRHNSWSDDSGEEAVPDFGEYEEIILNKREQQLPPGMWIGQIFVFS